MKLPPVEVIIVTLILFAVCHLVEITQGGIG